MLSTKLLKIRRLAATQYTLRNHRTTGSFRGIYYSYANNTQSKVGHNVIRTTQYTLPNLRTSFPRVYCSRAFHTESKVGQNDIPDHQEHEQGSEVGEGSAKLEKFATSTSQAKDIRQLRDNSTVVNIHLRNISSSITDLHQDLKSLANLFEKKTDDLSSKLDQKGDETDAKIDKALYILLATLLLGNAFYASMRGYRAGGNGSPQKETQSKMVSAKEKSA